jgi:hypothetical protein
MRSHYGLESAAEWQAYRRGFQSGIQRHREDKLIASLLASAVLAPIFAIAAAITHHY